MRRRARGAVSGRRVGWRRPVLPASLALPATRIRRRWYRQVPVYRARVLRRTMSARLSTTALLRYGGIFAGGLPRPYREQIAIEGTSCSVTRWRQRQHRAARIRTQPGASSGLSSVHQAASLAMPAGQTRPASFASTSSAAPDFVLVTRAARHAIASSVDSATDRKRGQHEGVRRAVTAARSGRPLRRSRARRRHRACQLA
jgi:hypothetical protein